MSATEIIVARPLALHLTWDGDTLDFISLRWAGDEDVSAPRTQLGRALAEALTRYVAGVRVEWPVLPVDLSRLAPFHRVVLKELYRIPAGESLSYGQLAERCGSPKAARAVGQVMAKNPWPLVFPCHRVLASGGGLGGFGPGIEMKKWLLELERKSCAG